jgi:hypothetical protein
MTETRTWGGRDRAGTGYIQSSSSHLHMGGRNFQIKVKQKIDVG